MGYLGSSLEDYYSYQLLDEVSRQIDVGDTGDWDKLVKKLGIVVEKVISRNDQTLKTLKQAPIKE
jgi:hypothetical protein